MELVRKFQTATIIFKRDGFFALLRAIRGHIRNKFGAYQPDENEIAFKALKADTFKNTMIDVGTHHGRALAPYANKGWQVYAFEPDSKNREILVSTFGESDNVVIDIRAVADKDNEKVVFYRSEESTGISGLSSFHESHEAADEVELITLSRYLDDSGITEPDINFLKIDAEGFDLNVLRGFPWQKNAPDVILCEFEDSKTVPIGYTFHDLAQYLEETGYKIIISEWYPIVKYGSRHKWRRFSTYPCQLESEEAWGNIIAAKDDATFDSLLKLCKLNN